MGVELNATIGQLVKMRTPIGCGATNMMPTRTHGIEKEKKSFSEGEHSDMTMSVAA